MNKRTFKIIQYVASFLFAICILFYLFRNQDPVKLVEEIMSVETKWVILSMLCGSIAIVSRGLRWIVLIDALNHKASKLNSISAVSIGYFTNLFVPRAGEITRCTSLSKINKIPVDKLFGTILIERVIDFIFLFSLLLITFIIKFTTITLFFKNIMSYVSTESETKFNTYLIFILVTICGFFFFKFLKKTNFYKKIISFIEGLKSGFYSIKYMKNKTSFWLHTLNIWIMYFLMTYVCFFCMQATSHLTISDGLFILVLGGIGMVIPTPGGIGSYHAIVMVGLSVLGVGTVLFETNEQSTNPALIFPTVIHAAQTLVAILMGCFSIIILFFSKKKNSETSRES